MTGHIPGLIACSLLAGLALFPLHLQGQAYPQLKENQVAWIGEQVYTNECNRNPDCLTAWNTGENFPSLGIGHFIWYRQDQADIFQQSFPDLMHFMQDKGMAIPAWIIATNYAAPWPDREAFQADMQSPRMQELRGFLETHMTEQTAFIIARFEKALADIVASETDAGIAAMITSNFNAVAASAPPNGLYALIDYVNFKGTGVSRRETYNNQGWGLKQVLTGMGTLERTSASGTAALEAFVTAARHILTTRVQNAPADRNESRWLIGWNNRLATYLP